MRSLPACLALASVALSCGPGPGPLADASAEPMDGPVDGASDAWPPPPAACAAIVDLETDGAREGETLRYEGSNADAPPEGASVGGLCRGGDGPIVFHYGREIAHRYVTRSESFVRIDVRALSTEPRALELSVRSDCSDARDATCGQTGLLPRGSELFVLVAERWTGSPTIPPGGPYELTVTELPPLAPGEPCDETSAFRCADARCASLRETCASAGMQGGECRAVEDPRGACDGPLVCESSPAYGAPTCIAVIPHGGECSEAAIDDRCADGTTCVGLLDPGRCALPGEVLLAPCRADGTCDAGLRCRGPDSTCVYDGLRDEPCRLGLTWCEAGYTCVPALPFDIEWGRCTRMGEAGTGCSSSRPCMPGLDCVMQPWDRASTCVQTVGLDAPCDPAGRATACEPGTSCARDATSFACVTDGSAPGAACRSDEPQCDASLYCTPRPRVPAPSVCAADTTDACDPRFGSDRCPPERMCAPTGVERGACLVAAEEPASWHANLARAAMVATTPALISGSLQERDCYVLDVGEGQSLHAEVLAAGCSFPVAHEAFDLAVYDPTDRMIARGRSSHVSGCPILDGATTTSPVHGLTRGHYVVCVSGGSSSSYLLALSLSP